jgi:serine/threonine-protein kinase
LIALELVGKQIGNYVVREKIGAGGMGSVYLCQHPLIGSRAAVKVLKEEHARNEAIVERFFREAKAATAIGHENIVQVLDFGRAEIEGQPVVYLLMELLEGESLASRLRRGPMLVDETRHVLSQCAAALAASHKKGIVHRDLKPDNIQLVHRSGDPLFVKLLDFGIAKVMDDPNNGHTRTGTVLGTPAYMSPEQCDGRGAIDHRSDIYSLGIVMFEMLTGRTPFEGRSYPEMLVAHITERTPPPSRWNPSVSPALDAIVLHATEIDRGQRIQDMDTLLQAIADPERHLQRHGAVAMTLTGVAAPRDPNATRVRAPTTLSSAAAEVSRSTGMGAKPRSRAGTWAGLAALGVAAVGGLGFALLRDGNSPATPAAQIAPVAKPAANDGFIDVSVDSTPTGAVVRHDGQRDTTPLSIHVKRGASLHLRFELDGYAPFENDVPTDRSRDVSVELQPQQAPKPHPQAAAPVHKTALKPVHAPATSKPAGRPDDIYVPKSLNF